MTPRPSGPLGAAPSGAAKYRDVRENRNAWGWVCLDVRCSNAVRCCRNRGANEVDRDAECNIAGNSSDATRSGQAGQRMAAVRLLMSQNITRLTEAMPRLYCHRKRATGQPCHGEFGENGKRYRLHYPASTVVFNAAGRYLSFNPNHSDSAPWRSIRWQQRCNLDRHRVVRTHFFPSNLQFGEAGGDAPV